MSGASLQVLGALLEVGGILTVALDITKKRATFTPEQPALARRAWSRLRRFLDRVFRRKRSVTLHVGTASSVITAGRVRARGTVGFGPWDDEEVAAKVERLRLAIENHERELTQLHSRVDDEERARIDADARQVSATDDVRRELTERVRDAAAGSLRWETIGVGLFAAGVAFQTWGNVAA